MTAGLFAAEWTKIRSVRSTIWTLLVFVVVAIGFSALVATVISNTWNDPGNHPNHITLATDPTAVLFGAGFDTSSSALTWWIGLMATNPETAGRLRQELDMAYERTSAPDSGWASWPCACSA